MSVPLDIQHEVNDRLIKAFQRGIEPFRRPFDPAPSTGRPTNIVSRTPYAGVNALLLDLHSIEQGFRSRWYGTKADWRRFDASVIAESGCRIVHRGQYVTVFNAEQSVGAERFLVPKWPWRHLPDYAKAQRLIDSTGADIRYGGDRCLYIPPIAPGTFRSGITGDFIKLPERHSFAYEQDFYYVAFHEVSHWGMEHLGWRDWYELGEFCAENVACSLCRALGVPPYGGGWDEQKHAAEVKMWVDFFTDDPRYVFDAAQQGSKTVDYLLSFLANGQTNGA